MKLKNTLMSATLALGLIVSASAASAKTVEVDSGGKSFADSWSLSKSGTDWVMNYGFNTDWIDEDYTHTKHNSFDHTATVANANGAYSDDDSSGYWAEIEVSHSGNSVQYSISY